jgi:hypothetical protein
MSWFRSFIRRHLIADDTAPQYSRLDQLDGLTATPASTPAAAETLDTVEPATTPVDTPEAALSDIEKRLTADENEDDGGVVDQSVRDRRHLLALVREQQSRLNAVAALHVREVLAVHEGYGEEAWCPACGEHWPCETIAAITDPEEPRA